MANIPSDTELEQEDDAAFEFTTHEELITCSYFAISAVSDLDTGIMSKIDAIMIKRIMRKSLKLIDKCIGELYEVEFEQDEED